MRLKRPTNAVYQAAYSLTEALVSMLLLGIILVSVFAGLGSGFAVVQLQRENLRATQIMVRKMESVRLYNWLEMNNTNDYLRNTFSDWFDPTSPNAGSRGAYYVGFVSTNAPAGVPADYGKAMRAVTVTMYWTNYARWPSTTRIVRSRQMQTYVARYGVQQYVYQ